MKAGGVIIAHALTDAQNNNIMFPEILAKFKKSGLLCPLFLSTNIISIWLLSAQVPLWPCYHLALRPAPYLDDRRHLCHLTPRIAP